ncbi:MAG: nicotinate-nucleotide adenylyltransferase [Clostridiales bacterium]|nr:nicotinate-nucleotide adenylyltransferase [Clostridiales bacterium]MBQ3321310.1 nicotinate-nucleotide adenylyltransferase [Bacillota bacterium]
MKKIGILGGTFDPVHYGHIALAEDAVREAGLHEVVMIPARIQPFKQDREYASGEDRFNMLALAAGKDDHITVSKYELQQKSISYTYLTLRHMQEFYGKDTRLYFITGTDSFLKIDTWMNAEELLNNYSYVIGTRPGYRQDEYQEALRRITSAYGTEVISMNKTELDISATQIRQMVAEGKPINDLVPPEVERYIREHGLYRT